ncbi:vitamin K epoxide reductase family protein [Rhodococcus jostii]|uniref:vitamin K epoxide reductase family protein n=1 Tax=Rhodococcus jostii TaxID=132919 RepID=UPI0036389573
MTTTDPIPVTRPAGLALIVLGGIGLAAAGALTVERFNLLIDPTYVPSCSINPIISCGTVMTTPQAALFGFPNPLLGLVAYTIVITTGVTALTGAVLPRWFWAALTIGVFLGEVLLHWLIFQSLYRIGALCPYCMIAWAITLPILIITTDHALVTDHPGAIPRFLHDWRWSLTALWYAAVLLLIAERFWTYWSTAI